MSVTRPVEHLPPAYRDGPVALFAAAFGAVLDELVDEVAAIAWVADPLGPGHDAHVPPRRTPDAFLSWLAGWLAVRLPAAASPETRRKTIAEATEMHRRRGTPGGLGRMLELVLGEDTVVAIDEFVGPAHFFQVKITPHDLSRVPEMRRLAEMIIDQERPAHTFYGLTMVTPAMRIVSKDRPDRLEIGKNTHLGNTKETS